MGWGRKVTKASPRPAGPNAPKKPSRLLSKSSAPVITRRSVSKAAALISNGSLQDFRDAIVHTPSLHPKPVFKKRPLIVSENRQLIGLKEHPGFPMPYKKPRTTKLPGHRGGIWEEAR